PCCATAPFTNPGQPLTLDETHRGTPLRSNVRAAPRHARSIADLPLDPHVA
ncbi:IS110 family transposase, partial [Burkholderia cenocepacia]